MVSFIAVEKCVTVILDHEHLLPLQVLRPQVRVVIQWFSRVGLSGEFQLGRYETCGVHCPRPASCASFDFVVAFYQAFSKQERAAEVHNR